MTHSEAAEALGMHYLSVMRLKRLGKLRPTLDGGVRDADVTAYLHSRTMPKGYVEGKVAAKRLHIPERAISLVARATNGPLLSDRSRVSAIMRRPGGGWWVSKAIIERLADSPALLASMGVKVKPPKGWLTRAQAAKAIKKSRSWVTRLGRRGTIRRRVISRHNTWYSAEDVRRYLVG